MHSSTVCYTRICNYRASKWDFVYRKPKSYPLFMKYFSLLSMPILLDKWCLVLWGVARLGDLLVKEKESILSILQKLIRTLLGPALCGNPTLRMCKHG